MHPSQFKNHENCSVAKVTVAVFSVELSNHFHRERNLACEPRDFDSGLKSEKGKTQVEKRNRSPQQHNGSKLYRGWFVN